MTMGITIPRFALPHDIHLLKKNGGDFFLQDVCLSAHHGLVLLLSLLLAAKERVHVDVWNDLFCCPQTSNGVAIESFFLLHVVNGPRVPLKRPIDEGR